MLISQELIRSFASQCHVRLVGSHHLANMAEAYISGETPADEVIFNEIKPCFVESDDKRTDIIVLACTHYPFLVNSFRRLAPWPVDWLDPAEAIAHRANSLLEMPLINQNTDDEKDDVALFTSGNPDFAVRRLQSGFGLRLVT